MPLRSDVARNAYGIAYKWLRYSHASGRDRVRLVRSFKKDFINIFGKGQLYLWDAARMSLTHRKRKLRGWKYPSRQIRFETLYKRRVLRVEWPF